MFELEENRSSGPSWVACADMPDGFQAQSFTQRRVADLVIRGLLYAFVILPLAITALATFTNTASFLGPPMDMFLTWLVAAGFALIGMALLWANNNSAVEHVLRYHADKNSIALQSFNRNGTRVVLQSLQATDITSMVLVDDESTSRTEQTYDAAEVTLKVAIGRKKHILLGGQEVLIWPIYLRLLKVLPNVEK